MAFQPNVKSDGSCSTNSLESSKHLLYDLMARDPKAPTKRAKDVQSVSSKSIQGLLAKSRVSTAPDFASHKNQTQTNMRKKHRKAAREGIINTRTD